MVSAPEFAYLLVFAGFISEGNSLNYTIKWLPELYLNFSLYLDGLSLFYDLRAGQERLKPEFFKLNTKRRLDRQIKS